MVKAVYKIRSIAELLESISSKSKIKKKVTSQFMHQESDIDSYNDGEEFTDYILPYVAPTQMEIDFFGNLAELPCKGL